MHEVKGTFIRIDGSSFQQHCQLRAEHHKKRADEALALFKEAKEYFSRTAPAAPAKLAADVSKFSMSGNTYRAEITTNEDPLQAYRDDVIKLERRAANFYMLAKWSILDAHYTLNVLEAEELELASIYRRKHDLT